MERFKLGKGEAKQISVEKVRVGLGWKVNEDPDGPDFDLDVSAFMIDKTFKIPEDGFFVFYGSENKRRYPLDKQGEQRPVSPDLALYGAIDEREGSDDDEGDTEDMIINLTKVDSRIEQIIITVTICKYPDDAKKDRRTLKLNFSMVDGCYVRILNEQTGEEILYYALSESFKTEDAVEIGRFYRYERNWYFEALGFGSNGSLRGLVAKYT